MYDSFSTDERKKLHQFSSLKERIDKQRAKALTQRLKTNPYCSEWEYLVGAFIEMYQYQLHPVVLLLFKKGYGIEVSSGFSGQFGECQCLNTYFPVSEQTKNTLGRIGVKVHENKRYKSISFYPEEADISKITTKWKQVVKLLPDKKESTHVATSLEAEQFRLTYIPADPRLKMLQAFENLRHQVEEQMQIDIAFRRDTQPVLNSTESRLGVFLEMLEPQVRDAVLELDQKGYSVDASGFMYDAQGQMIQGDFILDEKTVQELEALGVTVETNPSGYTRLQFLPEVADLDDLKSRWQRIAALFPDQGKVAEDSMTKKSREFRSMYATASP